MSIIYTAADLRRIEAISPNNAERIRQALSQSVDSRMISAPTDSDAAASEEAIQQAIIADLRARGYIVLQTTVRYSLVKCPSCSHAFHNHAPTGQTPGIPDLLVRADEWPLGAWLGIEVKSKKGTLSAEQKKLRQREAIVIARSPAEALAHVVNYERITK